MTYLVDQYYNPSDELGLAWNDPEVGADWGVDPGTEPILSERDQANPSPCRPGRPGSAAGLEPSHLSSRVAGS